ncbi:MAG: hypothetical protein AB8D52_09665 [Gammaproteobacteria bacterium]
MTHFIISIMAVLAIPVCLILYGSWVYQFYEKPVINFCDSLQEGAEYKSVITKSENVKNASINKFTRASNLVQLRSDTFFLGYICFMKFKDGKLVKAYSREAD